MRRPFGTRGRGGGMWVSTRLAVALLLATGQSLILISGPVAHAATPADVTVHVADKTYDGTTDATVTGCDITTDVGTDVVSCSTAGITAADFAAPDVNTGVTVTLTGALELAGADAGNWDLGTVTVDTADITEAVLTAVLTADNKGYDSTTDATGTCSVAADPDLVGGEVVGCQVDSADFDTAAKGTGKTVTASVSLTGADAGNYVLASGSVTDTADITALTLTAILTANDKVYDGSTAATGTCDVSADADLVPGDTVTCTVTSASFDTAAAGTGKTVTATVTLGGADAGGYVLENATITDTADITPAPLGILFTGTGYFPSTSVGLQATVSGACKAGQTVTFVLDANANGNFDDDTPLGTAITNSAGVATLTTSLAGGTVADVEVSVPDSANCTGAVGTTVIVVNGAGDASNGGGSYNNGGRMNFGYALQVKIDRKTGVKTVSGQILWQKQGASRFKGRITGYTTVACPAGTTAGTCALITGSGSTYTWNAGTGNWDLNVASTAFRVLVNDGGSSQVCTSPKKCTTVQNPDYFGIYFPYATVEGESTDAAGYPAVYLVKGGSLTAK